MATTGTNYDPKTTATQLATAYIQDRQSILTTQNSNATSTEKALTSLNSAMSTFDGVLASLSLKKSVLATTATFNTANGTASASTSATPGNYSFFVEQLATANQAAYDNLSDTTPVAEAGMVNISVGSATFAVDLTTADKSGDGILSVKELASAINTATGNASTVTASTMTVGGAQKLVLTSTQTGAANTVSIDGSALPAGALKDALALPANRSDLVVPKDAIIYLGDKATGTKLQQASNTYNVIDGVSMTFTKAQDPTETTPIKLTVATDSSGTTTNMQGFVDGWNALIKTLQTLTDSGNASSGTAAAVFHSDAGVKALQSRLQAVLRQQTNGISLVNYGITAQRDGTLTLDTTRLGKALAANPAGLDGIMGSSNLSTSTGVMGGLDKLLDQWTDTTAGQISKRRENNTKLQSSIMSRQTMLDSQYEASYNRYLAQFTQLQTLQAQMSSNTSIFDAMFSSNSN